MNMNTASESRKPESPRDLPNAISTLAAIVTVLDHSLSKLEGRLQTITVPVPPSKEQTASDVGPVRVELAQAIANFTRQLEGIGYRITSLESRVQV